MMPRIVQFGRQPYLLSGNAGVFDAKPNFAFIPIGKGSVDVTVAFFQSNFDSVTHLVGLTLPGAQTDGWNLVPGIEGEGLAALGELK